MSTLALREPTAEEWLAVTSSAERFAAVLGVILDESPSIAERSELLLAALLAGPVDTLGGGDTVAQWRGRQALQQPKGSVYVTPICELVAAQPGQLSARAIAHRVGCTPTTALRVLRDCGAEVSAAGWTLQRPKRGHR